MHTNSVANTSPYARLNNGFMSPSRGLSSLLRAQSPLVRSQTQRRPQQRHYSDLVKAVTNPSSQSQIYISRTQDPYLNLSIEHFLLQKSPPDSTILFLYTNRPCIVIGRNQNPWIEVNLGLLNTARLAATTGKQHISLVRRRSGGGTVFHDEGNVNYCVICPTAAFNRDKHAEMVVRALHKLGVNRARVNERHDIVLDGEGAKQGNSRPLKVSGSAYKLTRFRALHHGTCLLSSPNIETISQYLHSPAKPFVKARGVDSVNSPIANVNVSNEAFEQAVVSEFADLYRVGEPMLLTENTKMVQDISKGFEELTSMEWTYLQTPQFSFSSRETEDNPRKRPALPEYLPPNFTASFTARNGNITEIIVDVGGENRKSDYRFVSTHLNQKLHEVHDWTHILKSGYGGWTTESQAVSKWLNDLFGKDASRDKF